MLADVGLEIDRVSAALDGVYSAVVVNDILEREKRQGCYFPFLLSLCTHRKKRVKYKIKHVIIPKVIIAAGKRR